MCELGLRRLTCPATRQSFAGGFQPVPPAWTLLHLAQNVFTEAFADQLGQLVLSRLQRGPAELQRCDQARQFGAVGQGTKDRLPDAIQLLEQRLPVEPAASFDGRIFRPAVEHFTQCEVFAVLSRHGFIQRVNPAAFQLGGGVQGIILAIPGATPTSTEMLDRVVGDVAGADRFAFGLCAVQQAEGDHKTILQQFRIVLAASAGDGRANAGAKARGNFMEHVFRRHVEGE